MSTAKTRYHLDNLYVDNPLKFGSVYLIQIGRRYCEAQEVIPPHHHPNWFELTLISSGKGVVITNGKEYSVKTGDIYLSFPCDIHEIKADQNEKLEYDFFSFYCEDKTLNKDLKSITQNFIEGESRTFQDEKISELIKNAINEFPIKDDTYSHALITDIFHLVLIYLIRNFKDAKKKISNVSNARDLMFSTYELYRHAYLLLEKLENLAPRFNYNYSYLSKLFKNTTGKTLLEYHHHRKMEIAKTLIMEKKKKINEIAEMLGYNLYSFSKSFKSTYGISPKNMQK